MAARSRSRATPRAARTSTSQRGRSRPRPGQTRERWATLVAMTTGPPTVVTRPLATTARARHVAQFSIEVVSGPDAGLRAVSDGVELAIGTNPGNHLVL